MSLPPSPSLRRSRDLVVLGAGMVGKCFARGTRVRLFDGRALEVEHVLDGMELMGDDGLPRIVTTGSLTHGVDTLYRITPRWTGAAPFTVTSAHILVLVNTRQPSVSERTDWPGKWRVKWWGLNAANEMKQSSRTFDSQAQALAHCAAALPVEWEVSVEDFLSTSADVQSMCMLTACAAIAFQNPQLPSLQQVLTQAMGGVAPSAVQIGYMAWWLGMWITDGHSGRPSISQGGAPPPDPHHHHEIFARLRDYQQQQLFNGPVTQVFDRTSSAGWPAYWFNYGVNSVAGRVLRLYGLINNKHVPRALICDSISVRRRVLAGLIDGDGYYNPGKVYEIAAKHRHVIDGYKELAATLGLRNSTVADHDITNDRTGQVCHSYRINVSGDMWDVVQFCAAAYKRCPQPGTAGYVRRIKEARCYGFNVDQLDDEGEYFGFAVEGGANRRFLLEDYTVTHNVSLQSPTSPHPISCRSLRLTGVCAVLPGKSALCLRFSSERFDDSYEPTYENSFVRVLHYRSLDVECRIKDTQGLLSSDTFRSEYALGYHGYLLVYSVNSLPSFHIVKEINDRLTKLIGTTHIARVLVGNKSDVGGADGGAAAGAGGAGGVENLRDSRDVGGAGGGGGGGGRQVAYEMGAALASEWGVPFVECSAKSNVNVDRAFIQVLDEIERLQSDSTITPLSLFSSISSSLACQCCLPDLDSLQEGNRWERSVALLISLTLCVALLALAASITFGLQAMNDRQQLLAYCLFSFAALLTLVSIIGLFGIRQASVEYLRVFSISVLGLWVAEVVGYLVLVSRLEMGGALLLWGTVALTALLCLEGLTAGVVWWYANLLRQSSQSNFPSTSYQAL